jgi:hypothetical protein
LNSQATVHVATKVSTGTQGSITLNTDSALTIGSITGTGNTLAAPNTIQINSGGTLGGGGTINAQKVINGGTVAPGDPTTLTIAGDYTQTANGVLVLAIGGPDSADSDHLAIDGMFAVETGAVLQLDFIDGFAPTAGETFDLIDYQTIDPLNAAFSQVDIEGLQAGFEYVVTPVGGDVTNFQLTALNDGVSTVPEPSTYALIAVGLLILGFCPRSTRVRKPAFL